MKIDLNLLNDFNLFNTRDLTGTHFEQQLTAFLHKAVADNSFLFFG